MSQQQCLPLPPKRRKRPNRDDATKNDNENDDEDPKIGVGTTIDSLEHMDALEYLSSVHSQARSLPDVFVSKKTRGETKGASPGNDPSSGPKGGASDAPSPVKQPPPIEGSAASLSCLLSPRLSIHPPPTPRHLPPNPRRWTNDTLANFSELRSYMETCALNGVGGKDSGRRVDVPPMKDRTGWHEFCLGEDEAGGNVGGYFDDGEGGDDEGPGTAEEEEEEGRPEWKVSLPPEGNAPRVELLLQMDQVMVRRVLSHHVHFLTDGSYDLTPSRSKWLYGLLAALQKPLHREEASLMRELLRELTRRRSEIRFDGDEGGTADKESLVARINVLVVVVGFYFEQGGGYDEVMSVAI